MFTFKYRPQETSAYRKVIVPSDFIRIGSTMSYFSVQDGTYPEYKYTGLVFWSFETPIACVNVNRAYLSETNRDFDLAICVVINDASWDISRTTVKQLKRFLRIVAHAERLTDSFPDTVIEMVKRTNHAVQHEFAETVDSRACPHSCDVWTVRAKASRLWDEIDVLAAPVPNGYWK